MPPPSWPRPRSWGWRRRGAARVRPDRTVPARGAVAFGGAPARSRLVAFVAYAAPVVMSGEATFAGYVKLDDTASWLAQTDHVMERGRVIDDRAPPSSFDATLQTYVGTGLPGGRHPPLGVVARRSAASTPPGCSSPTRRSWPPCLPWPCSPCSRASSGGPGCGRWPPPWPRRRRCCSDTRCGAGSRSWWPPACWPRSSRWCRSRCPRSSRAAPMPWRALALPRASGRLPARRAVVRVAAVDRRGAGGQPSRPRSPGWVVRRRFGRREAGRC